MSGWNIFYGLINFAILAGALFLIGRKIVKGMLQKHRDEVSQGLEDAEKAAKNAEELLRELPGIRAKGEEAVKQIGRDAEEAARQSRALAAEEAAGELAKLRRDAAGEEQRYQRALRRELNAKAAEEICAHMDARQARIDAGLAEEKAAKDALAAEDARLEQEKQAAREQARLLLQQTETRTEEERTESLRLAKQNARETEQQQKEQMQAQQRQEEKLLAAAEPALAELLTRRLLGEEAERQ